MPPRVRHMPIMRLAEADHRCLMNFMAGNSASTTHGDGGQSLHYKPNIDDVVLLRSLEALCNITDVNHVRFEAPDAALMKDVFQYTGDRMTSAGVDDLRLIIPSKTTPAYLQRMVPPNVGQSEGAEIVMRRCFQNKADYTRAMEMDTYMKAYTSAGTKTRPGRASPGTTKINLRESDPFMDRVIRAWNDTLERQQDLPAARWASNGTLASVERTDDDGWIEAAGQPPPWVYGLDGDDFVKMYRQRIAWAKAHTTQKPKEHLENTFYREIPSCEEDWVEMIMTQLPDRMRDPNLRVVRGQHQRTRGVGPATSARMLEGGPRFDLGQAGATISIVLDRVADHWGHGNAMWTNRPPCRCPDQARRGDHRIPSRAEHCRRHQAHTDA